MPRKSSDQHPFSSSEGKSVLSSNLEKEADSLASKLDFDKRSENSVLASSSSTVEQRPRLKDLDRINPAREEGAERHRLRAEEKESCAGCCGVSSSESSQEREGKASCSGLTLSNKSPKSKASPASSSVGNGGALSFLFFDKRSRASVAGPETCSLGGVFIVLTLHIYGCILLLSIRRGFAVLLREYCEHLPNEPVLPTQSFK
mmetsp:Transcript_3804/g.8242  ORF Transcript_3804/g.8242 Transcript_3804/m.8242 type:complete len:203 (+) Transcript_3804:476-1084(+)